MLIVHYKVIAQVVFRTDRITLSLFCYNFGLQQSINNGSFTNLEIQHNNVVHAKKLLCHFSNILMSSTPQQLNNSSTVPVECTFQFGIFSVIKDCNKWLLPCSLNLSHQYKVNTLFKYLAYRYGERLFLCYKHYIQRNVKYTYDCIFGLVGNPSSIFVILLCYL